MFDMLLSCSLNHVSISFLVMINCTFVCIYTATLKSWSLYIHGYTTRSPLESSGRQQWSDSSVSSSSLCEEPGNIGVYRPSGVSSVADSRLLITFCLVLWKAVILTCSRSFT